MSSRNESSSIVGPRIFCEVWKRFSVGTFIFDLFWTISVSFSLHYYFFNCYRILVNTFLILYQTGKCSAYIIFISANILKLVNPYMEMPLPIEIYMLMLFPLLFILSLPNIKWLVVFYLLSHILRFITFGILLFYISEALARVDNVDYWGDIKTLPLFVGTCFFAVSVTGEVTYCYNKFAVLKRKSN